MRKPYDASTGINAHAELFFLKRLKPADIPVPYRDPVAHEAIGFLKPQGAFEKDLLQAGVREHLSTFVICEIVTQAVEIRFGYLICLFAIHAKIERGNGLRAVKKLDITGETERTCDQKANDPYSIASRHGILL